MTMELKNQKCQACSGNTPKFDEKQITDNLSKLIVGQLMMSKK